MIVVSGVGWYAGREENRSFEDYAYVIIRPLVSDFPSTFKQSIAARNRFEETVTTQLSQALICVPVEDECKFREGQLGRFSASFWSLSDPRWWSARQEVDHSRSGRSVLLLRSLEASAEEVTNVPWSFEMTGGFTYSKLKEDGLVEVRMQASDNLPDVFNPEFVLRVGSGFQSSELLAHLEASWTLVSMPLSVSGGIPFDEEFTLVGSVWPVFSPYVRAENNVGALSKMTSYVFMATRVLPHATRSSASPAASPSVSRSASAATSGSVSPSAVAGNPPSEGVTHEKEKASDKVKEKGKGEEQCLGVRNQWSEFGARSSSLIPDP